MAFGKNGKRRKIGRIANPVVHSILNQLRKVINEIIRLYGKPEMIKLEVARDFGMSKKSVISWKNNALPMKNTIKSLTRNS